MKTASTPAVRPLRITRRFPAAAARVFDAWLEPSLAGRWLFATAGRPMTRVEIDARERGNFRFAERRDDGLVVHAGRYIEIERPRRLVFTLAQDTGAHAVTRVTVDVAPLASGCRLVVTHDGVPRERAVDMTGRWAGMLYGLGALLGADGVNPRRRAEEPKRGQRVPTLGNGGTSCNTF